MRLPLYRNPMELQDLAESLRNSARPAAWPRGIGAILGLVRSTKLPPRPRVAFAFAFAFALVSCSATSEREPAAASGMYAAAPAFSLDKTKTYAATLTTAKGTIEVALDVQAAPTTVNNFVFLARDRFYDGLVFHRVEAGFVIQGGDPSGDGTGGPGYTIPDEANRLSHVEGALAMAKSAEPNSAGSQFYVTLAEQPSLDGRYTVFGKVTSGMGVVKSIAKGDAITRVTVTEK
jgi:peptidyl-prolyl cis-trans isomerase B (cyclophilin B)